MIQFTREQIKFTYSNLSSHIIRTPCLYSNELSRLVSRQIGRENCVQIFIKSENKQITGSFKYRGALHSMLKLRDEQLRKGVVTYSTGNHAHALAHAASIMSIKKGFRIPFSTIMNSTALPEKIESIKSGGANVKIIDSGDIADCRNCAVKLASRTHAALIPPSDYPDIVLGQGTAALEFAEQVKENSNENLDAIVLPCGGGSLLAGSAVYFRGSGTKVFGAEPVLGAPRLVQSVRGVGRLEGDFGTLSIADGLRSSVGTQNREILCDPSYLEAMYTVSDDQIRQAARIFFASFSFYLEPSAAVPLAAVLFNDDFHSRVCHEPKTWRIGIIVTGGNISVARAERIASI